MARRRRRYLLNTCVPLSAWYGSPVTRRWLSVYGPLSYYSEILELELRGHSSKTSILNMLRAYGVAKLSVDKGRLRRRAERILAAYDLPDRLLLDVMHVLAARENGLVIVSYDEDVERVANLLGAPFVRPWGRPYGPQDVPGPRRRESRERGENGARKDRRSANPREKSKSSGKRRRGGKNTR